MASYDFQKSYVENFLFREAEAKLFVFKKNKNNPISIMNHIMNVKIFLNMLGLNEESKPKLEIFSKYFDEDIVKDVKCEPGYDNSKETTEYLEESLIKILETKKSRISNAIEAMYQRIKQSSSTKGKALSNLLKE